MKNVFYIATLVLVALAFSCSRMGQEESAAELLSMLTTRSSTSSHVQTDSTLHSISSLNPLLKSRIQQHFGDKRFSKQTVSRNGVPLVQVLNFSGGGWAIVDGRSENANQVLAYGKEDCFDAENIASPEVAFWFRMIQSQLSCEKELTYDIKQPDHENQPSRSLPIDYSQDYYWVRLPRSGPVVVIDTVSSVPHLIQTKWGQLWPWNYLCHDEGYTTVFPTGCSSVAVAQMLYYLHGSINAPSGLYHTIEPSFTAYGTGSSAYWSITSIVRDDYISPSGRWSTMALNAGNGSRTSATDYVGALMVDIGQRMNTKYRMLASSTDYFGGEIFSEYGIACNTCDYNQDTVKSYLSNSQPVLIQGWDSKYSDSGHAWIIDGYQVEKETTYRDCYQWVLIPPDSLCYYPYLNYDYVLTEQEKQWLYPTIQENDYVYECPLVQQNYTYLRMNWGSDGYLDNALYSLHDFYGWTSSSDTLGLDYGMRTIHNYRLE